MLTRSAKRGAVTGMYSGEALPVRRVLQCHPQPQRRKLNLKAKFDSGSSHFGFKRWNQACFQLGV